MGSTLAITKPIVSPIAVPTYSVIPGLAAQAAAAAARAARPGRRAGGAAAGSGGTPAGSSTEAALPAAGVASPAAAVEPASAEPDEAVTPQDTWVVCKNPLRLGEAIDVRFPVNVIDDQQASGGSTEGLLTCTNGTVATQLPTEVRLEKS